MVVFSENQDLRHFINSELFAKFLFIVAVQTRDFYDSVQFLTCKSEFFFKLFAFIQFVAIKIDDPDFLSAVETAHIAQVKFYYVHVLEQVGKSLLLLMEVEAASEAAAKEVIEAEIALLLLTLTGFVFSYAFSAFSVVDCSFVWI